MAGRPIEYTEDIGIKICELISSSSVGLDTLLDDESLPSPRAVYYWLDTYPEFLQRYARAREMQADFLAGQTIEIADDSANDTIIDDQGRERVNSEWVNRSRLRVDARKWMASKLAPVKYGDKIDITTKGDKIAKTTTMILPDGSKIEL